jgi:Fe-S-cluster-containing hydrogenase component 2
MTVLFERKQDCCGCGACASICPKQAITMKPDADGFTYPVLDDSACVDCGLCVTTCAFQNVPVTADGPLATYAAVNKDAEALSRSSSGGVFAALASLVFEKSGVVFGCAFNDDLEPEHICIDNPADVARLQGSKYVQSDVKNTYAEAKKSLQVGRCVLYTGTPCQIAGLKAYLGRDYDSLITADLVCHGVPSTAFFKGYIAWLEYKRGGKVAAYRFRDKTEGSMSCGVGKVVFRKGGMNWDNMVYSPFHYYYQYFLSGDICRESCYTCKYAGGNRQGDFTMGVTGASRRHILMSMHETESPSCW